MLTQRERERLDRFEAQLEREAIMAARAGSDADLKAKEASELATHTAAWRKGLVRMIRTRSIADWFLPASWEDGRRFKISCHESGHAVAHHVFGDRIRSVGIIAGAGQGGRVIARRGDFEPWQQLAMILAGPMA